ncbi:hypothetical protein NEOLEDRAFT_1102312 [Neolentinus lepideus HHB14362 ss-1]|uniref:Transcriptional regulatory protein RXT2 N-terminal domain-containing protein n=1 Tax=Neolentinus lepideus HHB14362 ss-1 TaxID=1314782 RepID=A0A165NAM2_9AGAM|nr:hypothetical protein NEOLEDRAFT_1102312 [Neolentinus lepideus HHB14362 ss-1]
MPSEPSGTSQASGSQQPSGETAGMKRSASTIATDIDANYVSVPSNDHNSWYFPCHGYDSDEEERVSSVQGNWGLKHTKNSRWMRRGKMVAWGPGMDDWEAEERARKRVKYMLSRTQLDRSPSPPSLPHLRSPSPPLRAPYPAPEKQHLSYASFVMDKGVTHSFRSSLLEDLEQATNNLIQGEGDMRRALGRLWQVMSEDPDKRQNRVPLVPKPEPQDEPGDEDQDTMERRFSRAPDLTPASHKIFFVSYTNGALPVSDPSYFAPPEMQLENLEKSLASLRELLDDGREYIERLEEIREGLGEVKNQRNAVWDMVRERAIKELQDTATSMAASQSR